VNARVASARAGYRWMVMSKRTFTGILLVLVAATVLAVSAVARAQPEAKACEPSLAARP